MKRNYNNTGSFETLNFRTNEEKTACERQDFPSWLKRNTIILFLLAVSLVWSISLPVRAKNISAEENSTEETGTEETGTETDYQDIAEQVADFILSLQTAENETDDQTLAERIGNFIHSFRDEESEAGSQSAAEQAANFLSSLLTENGASDTQTAAELVEDIPTTQYFTDEPVSAEDIEAILNAGINSPSGMNSQPWHFSVITDASLLQQISDEMNSTMAHGGKFNSDTKASTEITEETSGSVSLTKAGIADAPLAIVISCAEGSELDTGITCQTMSIEAQLLGYGSKIISSPTSILNGDNQEEYRELLGIPDGYSAAAVLLIGREDTSADESMDGYTSATTRNSLDDLVTYVDP